MRPAGLLTRGSTLTPAFPAGPKAGQWHAGRSLTAHSRGGGWGFRADLADVAPRESDPYPIPVSLRTPWQPEHRSHTQQAPNTLALSSNPGGETRQDL